MAHKLETIETKKLNINTGQIPGVPTNPRIIKTYEYQQLKDSIAKDPEMLELKEPWAYLHEGEYVVIAGNMRVTACKELGIKKLNVKVLDADTPPEKLKAFAIKDNIEKGEWDWDVLANEWEAEEIKEWGVPIWLPPDPADYDLLKDDILENREQALRELLTRALRVEFSEEDYPRAVELCNRVRANKDLDLGKIILEALEITVG